MWRLLRKTNSSSRQRGGLIPIHINGLGTGEYLFMSPLRGPKRRVTVLARSAVSRQPARIGAVEQGRGIENPHC
jgi:hypothetical protein